ncbi:MAG: hypothetical protein CR972_02560 [Candidatus Moraniibacteriota bacterium]|nr:MAG: hypothetical protein CR972_02560 [Candidatus Moranbacteria bacterium]
MFGIKGRDTFNKPFTNRAKVARMLKEKWIRYFPFILILLACIVIAYVVYVWYVYVHTKELTETERMTYINERRQEVVFRKKKFDQVKDGIIMREERFNAKYEEKNDIFYHINTQKQEENQNVTE